MQSIVQALDGMGWAWAIEPSMLAPSVFLSAAAA
jgi:hypothetical protein